MKKLIAFAAVGLTTITSPALALCDPTVGPCLFGAPGNQPWLRSAPQAGQPTPLPVPQTTYGTNGNQSFSITQWPNGMVTIDR